jgi:hypothetical protein
MVITASTRNCQNKQKDVIKSSVYEITEAASEGNIYMSVDNYQEMKNSCN